MKKKIKKNKSELIVLLTSLFLLISSPVFADNDGVVTIENPIRFDSINEFLTALTNLLIQLGLALVVFMIVLGGAYIMLAGANPQNIEKGKNIIKWTVLGVGVVIFARAILALIHFTLGI